MTSRTHPPRRLQPARLLSGLALWAAAALAADPPWQIVTVATNSTTAAAPSLAFSFNGNAGIAYQDVAAGHLCYARPEGLAWSVEVVDSASNVGAFAALDFPIDGNPAIAYYDAASQDLKYAHHDGVAWSIATVDSAGDVGAQASLGFGPDGNPAIAYLAGPPANDLKYASFDGTNWTTATLVSTDEVVDRVSLAFDSGGYPAIAYRDQAGGQLKLLLFNGTVWSNTTVDADAAGLDAALDFSFDGQPAIGHRRSSSVLTYAQYDGSQWTTSTVPGVTATAAAAALRWDGVPAFSFHLQPSPSLGFASHNGSTWQVSTVDSNAGAGTASSLAFDLNGQPAIAYRDTGSSTLKFARQLLEPPSSISFLNHYLYAANAGWGNAKGGFTNGLRISRFYVWGYAWLANCGWLNCGRQPSNGWRYANTAGDWGVNIDQHGRLRGFAYGGNVGWIQFETNGNPRVDWFTGAMSGYAYGANLGWISLSNSYGFTQTDVLASGYDTDGDGLPDPWEMHFSSNLTALAGGAADSDGDGQTDAAEYVADTNPLNAGSLLTVTALTYATGTYSMVWTVQPTRQYRMEQSADLTDEAAWTDAGLGLLEPGSSPSVTGQVSAASATSQYYRARSIIPLSP